MGLFKTKLEKEQERHRKAVKEMLAKREPLADLAQMRRATAEAHQTAKDDPSPL